MPNFDAEGMGPSFGPGSVVKFPSKVPCDGSLFHLPVQY